MEVILLIALVWAGYTWYKTNQELKRLKAKYSGVEDARAEVEKIRIEISNLRVQRLEVESALLKAQRNLDEVDSKLYDISIGLYKPIYNLDTSEEYKAALEKCRKQQSALVKAGQAVECTVKWEIAGDAKEGARLVKQLTQLSLRAFNGECDAAVANVTWNNIARLEQRIIKLRETLNSLTATMRISITDQYLKLKLTELRLKHELEDKRQQEREEQRQIREQMREEEKARRELERAREEAQKEEERYARALEKARLEAAKASGDALVAMNEKIAALELQLQQAHEMKERAISQAQLTKSGHVYVISNIGSFGENVFKIGMTRRLEPLDRVLELGDASVPFPFDVHAMIYSNDAPNLEAQMHRFFNDRRVNMVNLKKEFFSVSIDEIEQFARQHGVDVSFTKVAEARQFRETQAIKSGAIAAPAMVIPVDSLDSVLESDDADPFA